MRLRNRPTTLSVGPPGEVPKSRAERITQLIYLALLLALIAYLLQLGWRYATRLEIGGQVMVQTRVLSAPRAGAVTPWVIRGQYVTEGETLAVIDPQLACETPVLEDKRLEQVRHNLRLAVAQEKLLDDRLQRVKRESPASTVHRALELDSSRGDAFLSWQERLASLEAERELARVETSSQRTRLAEITAQSALSDRPEPACLAQALKAPDDAMVVTVRRDHSEYIERGEPLVLLRAKAPVVWIEVFAEAEELAVLSEKRTAKVIFPDGRESEGEISRVESSATGVPAIEMQDYVPVDAALRVVLEPQDELTAAVWRAYSRMSVKVMVKR